MNWMDAVVIIVLVVELIRCFKQGMVKSVVEMAGWAAALIAAKIYYKQLAAYLVAHYPIFSNLESNILEGLTKHMTAQGTQALTGGSPIGHNLLLPKVLNSLPSGSQSQLNQMVYGDLAHRLSELIINGLSFMAVVMGVMAALTIVAYILEGVMHLPLLREVNRLGGLGIGLIKGVFSIWVLMTLLTFVLPFMKGGWLLAGLTQSQYAIYFYNNNLLLYLIYFLLR